jgi:hypothetical protein
VGKVISRREAAKVGVAAGLACVLAVLAYAWGGARARAAAAGGLEAQAKKSGRVGIHYKLRNQYTVIIHYDGGFEGMVVVNDDDMIGCKRNKNASDGDEIKWKVAAGGVVIDPDDNTALRITATPSKSGKKCKKKGRGLGELTVTVTNGDAMMTQVVSNTIDVVYDD